MTNAPHLVVASGLQKGAKVPLPRGESRVGSDPSCSVVVIDSTMEGCHLRVVVEDVVQLRCDFPVILSDGTAIASGDVFEVPANCQFTAGSTEFELALPVPPLPQRRLSRLALTGTAALGAAVVALTSMLVMDSASPAPGVTVTSAHLVASNASNVAAAVGFLQQQIGAAGLLALKVAAQPDGGIVIEGMLPAKAQGDWSAIRQRYDRQFGTAHVLLEHFTSADDQPPLRVAAVWSGPDPYVVDQHGDRLRVGANLGGGWSIQGIDGRQVMIRRGTASVALRY